MSTVTLSSEQWSRIHEFLQGQTDLYIGKEAECRRFIDAVLWITRTGAQWRMLPVEYGNWNSVYKRFARWCERGVWERMHQYFVDDPDMEHFIIDSTVVRAHPSAAGASKKRRTSIASPRSQPRWVQHKGPCRCRRTRQPVEIQVDWRARARCHSGRSAHIRYGE